MSAYVKSCVAGLKKAEPTRALPVMRVWMKGGETQVGLVREVMKG